MRKTPGVSIRETSIRIVFRYNGKQRLERLCLDNESLAPTPANIKYAIRLAAEIRDKIRLGTFKYADYFPNSPQAKAETIPTQIPLLFDIMDRWLRIHEIKASTRGQYTTRINSFWKAHLKNVPIDQVRYSDILEALAEGTWTSAKSRNNELSMIRGPFELARLDKHIIENPCDGIKGKELPVKTPDPFTFEETSLVLEHLRARRPEQIFNYVQLMFFSGLRTSEGVGLHWNDIDFRSNEMYIHGGNVYDEETSTTKTSKDRTVHLNEMALEALLRQKAHTFLDRGHVFHDPKTDMPWKYRTITDARGFWEITLRQLGIRYRRPYNMRHTYATIGLMSGAKPGFLADQLGHSLRMFFEVYARWLRSIDDKLEVAKIDGAIKQQFQNNSKARKSTDKDE